MRKDDMTRLRHMLEAAQDCIVFINDKSRKDLDNDKMLIRALMKSIEIIGEAASKVSADGRKLSPNIPWQDIIGMRNRLIHAYFNVNLDILWNTITVDLPPLIAELEAILASYDQP